MKKNKEKNYRDIQTTSEIKVEKLIDGTYGAYVKAKITETREYFVTLTAIGKTEQEAQLELFKHDGKAKFFAII